MANVLLVDDDEAFCQATSDLLDLLGHKVQIAGTVTKAKAALVNSNFDQILLDLMLPDGSGLQLLESIPNGPRATKITVITGHPAVKNVVKSMYGPNVNYLIKPIDIDQLKGLLSQPQIDEATLDSSKHFGCLIGETPVMRQLYEMIERVAKTSANVMLLGESGVGKEVVASAIHYASGASGPFVAANCGAFARELIGSELFGHERGAFTGAVGRKPGLFEQANGGTLFLDEVTEMPLDLQPNLLRVLETSKVTRLGGTKSVEVNCRVISATNRSEHQLVEEECLREDLYFRLAVFPIRIPSLQERIEDIPLLAESFLASLNKENNSQLQMNDEALAKLCSYDWPGNVRELRHAVHRAFIMSDPNGGKLVLPKDLASPFSKGQSDPNRLHVGKTIEEVERELINLTLAQLDGDKKQAADMLGISLKTLYNRLNAYESSTVRE